MISGVMCCDDFVVIFGGYVGMEIVVMFMFDVVWLECLFYGVIFK